MAGPKKSNNAINLFGDGLVQAILAEGMQRSKIEINVIDFARDILGVKLWPTQMAILKAIYNIPLGKGYWRDCLSPAPFTDEEDVFWPGGYLESCGFAYDEQYDEREILSEWAIDGKTTWVEGARYSEMVLECGMRGSKTSMTSIPIVYEFFKLLQEDDPATKFGLMPGSLIALLVLATSEEQAQDTLFAAIKGRIENSAYFQGLIQQKKLVVNSLDIYCPDKNLKLWCGHSRSAGLVGRTLMMFGMDEANRFGIGADGSAMGTSGIDMYANVGKGTTTLRSFGAKKFVISSAWCEGDCTDVLYQQVERQIEETGNSHILAFRLATWDINPKFMKLGEDHPEIQQEYRTRGIEAKRDYAGIRPGAEEAFFNRHLVAAQARFELPMLYRPLEREVKGKDGSSRKYAAIQIMKKDPTQIIVPSPFFSYGHCDPGLKHDSFGFVGGHPEIDPNTGLVIANITTILEWRPVDKGRGIIYPVDYENVEEQLLSLADIIRLKRLSFDHWNSAMIIQRLYSAGISTSEFKSSFSQPVQREIYEMTREWITNGRVKLPKRSESPAAEKLHKELEELVLMKGRRIDHPKKGCFTGDTRVSLLDGRELNFEQLVAEFGDGTPFHVYAVDPATQDMKVGVAFNPRLTAKKAAIVAVTLDNGEVIRCTPDHRFMLRDGSWCEAGDLVIGASLMPLYRGVTDGKNPYKMKGYETYMNPRNQKYYLTHWMVGEFKYGERYRAYRGKGLVLHHEQGKRNNDPAVLKLMTSQEHGDAHREDLKTKRATPVFEAKREENFLAYARSPEGRELSRQTLRGIWERPEYREKMAKVQSAVGKKTGAPNITRYNKSETKRERTKILQAGRTNSNARKDVTVERILALVPTARRLDDVANALKCSRQTVRNILKAEAKLGVRLVGERLETFSLTPAVINHKVISVEPAGFEDVYDISVHEWENFALTSGVFVHNSKDLSDCLACVVWHISQDERRYRYFETGDNKIRTSGQIHVASMLPTLFEDGEMMAHRSAQASLRNPAQNVLKNANPKNAIVRRVQVTQADW